jgi:hypothetical protein
MSVVAQGYDVNAIVADDANVIWGDGVVLKSVAVAGGTPMQLTTMPRDIGSLAVDQTSIFIGLAAYGDAFFRYDRASGSSTQYASADTLGGGPMALAVGPDAVYTFYHSSTNSNYVVLLASFSKTGEAEGKLLSLTPTTNPVSALWLLGSTLYWIDGGQGGGMILNAVSMSGMTTAVATAKGVMGHGVFAGKFYYSVCTSDTSCTVFAISEGESGPGQQVFSGDAYKLVATADTLYLGLYGLSRWRIGDANPEPESFAKVSGGDISRMFLVGKTLVVATMDNSETVTLSKIALPE